MRRRDFIKVIAGSAATWPLAARADRLSRNREARGSNAAAERLDAAAVMINDHTAFRTDWMPFAGRHVSGHGVGGIPYTMQEMRADKMIVFK